MLTHHPKLNQLQELWLCTSQLIFNYLMLLPDNDSTLPQPAHWSILSFSQQKAGRIQALLSAVRSLLQKINRIKEYVSGNEDINEIMMRMLQSSLPLLKCEEKQAVLIGKFRPLVESFEKAQSHQRKVSQSFIQIIRTETQRNMGEFRNRVNQVDDGYTSYIKQQQVKSLVTLKQFIQRENKFYTDYCKNNVFFRRLMPQLYERAIQNRIQESSHSVVQLGQYRQIGNQNGRNIDRLELLSEQLRKLDEDLDGYLSQQENPQQKQSQAAFKIIASILLVVLAVCIGGLTYAFCVFDEFERLGNDQQAWTGAGGYLIYQWINCALVYYCYTQRINVLLGMNCKSPQDIFFFRPSCFVLLFSLTLVYLCLLIVYLLWVGQPWMGMIINGLLLASWLAELLYRLIRMRNVNAFASKLSFLHFLTLIVPINDISCSLLPEKNNAVTWSFYLATAIAAAFLQTRRKQLINQTYLINYFIYAFSITILTQFVTLFLGDSQLKSILIWICVSLNLIILCFFIRLRFEPLSIQKFFGGFLQALVSLCCLGGQEQLVKWRLDEANSYHRIIKVFLTLVSLIFVLILPLGVHWDFVESYIHLHRYGYYAIVQLGYFAWNFLYINEANINLKHPLGNMTRLSHSLSFNRIQNHKQAEKYREIRFDYQSLEEREKAMQQFDKFDLTALEASAKGIYKELSQNYTFYLVQEQEDTS